MTTKKTVRIEKALTKKGFFEEQSHHTYFYFFHNGKKTDIFTYLSHGKKEISKNLRSKMAAQLRLSPPEFDQLIDCTKSREELTQQYEDLGLLEP